MSQYNPYAAPKTRVQDEEIARVDIDSLSVSETWKTRFRLIEAAGGIRLPEIKSLPFGERSRVMFNILAFLFGPLYYVAKGLWRKAITFFALGVLVLMIINGILLMMGIPDAGRALSYGLAAVFATRANLDYYKRMVLKNNGWW